MITLMILLLTMLTIGFVLLVALGGITISFWWLILIILDVAIAIGIIRFLFKKKDKEDDK